MAKGDATLSYTFRGSKAQLRKIQKLIDTALQEDAPKPDPAGPITDWPQTGGWVQDLGDKWPQKGGWYLVKEDKKTKVARPEKAVTQAITAVTASVVQALTKAKSIR
jgi:hypothetical protein